MTSSNQSSSVGGSDDGFQRLDALLHLNVRHLNTIDERFSHPNPAALAVAMTAIIEPFQTPSLRELSAGTAGVTDGRTLWLDEQFLRSQVNKDTDAVAMAEWLDSCLLTMAKAALGQTFSGGCVAVVSTDELKAALVADGLDVNEPSVAEATGYAYPHGAIPAAMSLVKANVVAKSKYSTGFAEVKESKEWSELALPDAKAVEMRALGSHACAGISALERLSDPITPTAYRELSEEAKKEKDRLLLDVLSDSGSETQSNSLIRTEFIHRLGDIQCANYDQKQTIMNRLVESPKVDGRIRDMAIDIISGSDQFVLKARGLADNTSKRTKGLKR